MLSYFAFDLQGNEKNIFFINFLFFCVFNNPMSILQPRATCNTTSSAQDVFLL